MIYVAPFCTNSEVIELYCYSITFYQQVQLFPMCTCFGMGKDNFGILAIRVNILVCLGYFHLYLSLDSCSSYVLNIYIPSSADFNFELIVLCFIFLQLNGDSGKSISKRSRKKKTLTELKDEENSLLKERRNLKRDIAALRINLEEQIAKNENLKRIKIELQPLLDAETVFSTKEPVSDNQLHPDGPAITPPLISDKAVALHSNDCPTSPIKDATTSHAFMLPDLNMPFEDACPDVLCSVS
ncbi:hypothetical protein SASPL_128762 [Salvia splendens]|uniref:BZIP domain-containing protein n=1 Tax=Salvia splendens TaxID=180675 RepID=A0A8X8ZMU5_SALSN|nr:hypothetical protein SASPL_128762 [Salvia splendens]